jgi:hypothetical protein
MGGTVTLISETANAKDIDVTLSCPTTITPNATLNLGLTLENESSDPVTIAKSAIAFQVSNLSIIGPSVVPLSLTLAAGGAPGDTAAIPAYFSTTIRRLKSGTFLGVGVAVMKSDNTPMAEGHCIIEVL